MCSAGCLQRHHKHLLTRNTHEECHDPFTHSCLRSARHPPPVQMRLITIRSQSPVTERQNKFPCFKSSWRRKVPASQLRRSSAAISKDHARLTVARVCKSQCRLLGEQAKSQGQIQPQHLWRPTRASMAYSILDPDLFASLESGPKELFLCLSTCKQEVGSYLHHTPPA